MIQVFVCGQSEIFQNVRERQFNFFCLPALIKIPHKNDTLSMMSEIK